MNIAIVDDNEKDIQQISSFIDAWSQEKNLLIHIDSFKEGTSFREAFPLNSYDLIFMDIFMEESNGIEIVREIRQFDMHTFIVFLTTSKESIYEAASLHFFDYLLKPVTKSEVIHVLEEITKHLPQQETVFSFPYRKLQVQLKLSDIYYITADNHDTKFYTKSGKQCFRVPFSSILSSLSDARFLECNRGVLLNMDYIQSMESDVFEMIDGKSFPIKRNGRKEIRQRYVQYQFDKLGGTL